MSAPSETGAPAESIKNARIACTIRPLRDGVRREKGEYFNLITPESLLNTTTGNFI